MSPIRQSVQFDKKLLDPDALKIVKKLNKIQVMRHIL